MEASATVFQLPFRRRLLIKCADWAGAAGTARDILDVLVASELHRPLVRSRLQKLFRPRRTVT